MKKLTFLVGSLGGALAGYVFSNNKLRKELMDAKDTAAAAKILGKHLSADGHVVAKEARQFAEEHHLDKHVAKGKKYVKNYYDNAKDEVQKFLGDKVEQASKAATKAAKRTVKSVKKAVR
jgi:hypothetical protein